MVIHRISRKVEIHSISPTLPPGDVPHCHSEPAFDMCPCGSMVESDAHRLLIFYRSPADIEHAPTMGGVPSEWRPCPESPPIPGDRGPHRVGYWLDGKAVVQIHEGDDAGYWTPCYSYTVTRDGMPYSMWVCRRGHVDNPCDADYLRSIST